MNEPSFSPDGGYLYYREDMYPGRMFQYNKDPNKQIYVIKRYDFETCENTTITSRSGGAARSQVSPDGKKFAFIKRVRTNIHDLESGEEWPVYDSLSKDQQKVWAIFGVYPGFSWMPSGNEIVFWAGVNIPEFLKRWSVYLYWYKFIESIKTIFELWQRNTTMSSRL